MVFEVLWLQAGMQPVSGAKREYGRAYEFAPAIAAPATVSVEAV